MSDGAVLPLRRKTVRPSPVARPDWLAGAVVDHKGSPLGNVANAMLALRNLPALATCFAFDGMRRAAYIVKPLPFVTDEQHVPRQVRDTDVTALQEFLQHEGLARIGRENLHAAVDLRAQERGFHPVRAYLERLEWDGCLRLETWTKSYLGADDTPYSRAIGAMFLTSMVARIMRPGVKADHMLVLEGAQGTRKSTACQILGGLFYSDALPDVRDKDASEHMRGVWLVEIAELSSMRRADAESLKAFVSRTTERYRPPYGRRTVDEPRQCVFIGTTNRSTYLQDETGGRRFWPLKTGRIHTDRLAVDRDQLFAEAVQAFRRGARWWPDETFEREHIKPEQDDRFDADPWDVAVAAFVDGRSRVGVLEVAEGALRLPRGEVGTAVQRRIGAVLTTLGWRATRDHRGRGYEPPPSASPRRWTGR